MIVVPWSIDPRLSGAVAEELRRRVVGTHVRRVYYETQRDADWWGDDYARGSAVHEAGSGIVLSLDSGTQLIFSWQMEGLNEGLRIEVQAGAGHAYRDIFHRRVATSSVPPWPNVVASEIQNLALSFHAPCDGCPRTLWAARLQFASGASAVVALGEVDSLGKPRYFPQQLVVIFDERIAREYGGEGSVESSWGTVIE